MTAHWENIVATVTLVDYDDCQRFTDNLYSDGRPWVCTVDHKAAQHHIVVATLPLDANQVPGDNYAQLAELVLNALQDTTKGGRATFVREHVIDHEIDERP